MTNNRLQNLLEKHIAFGCNDEEEKELAKLIESASDDLLKQELLKLMEQYEPTTRISQKEKESKLEAILHQKPEMKLERKPVRYFRLFAAVAASFLILFTIGWMYVQKSEKHSTELAVVIKAPEVLPNQATSYIRNLTLPDGTSVILKAGSTLHFPDQFAGKTREVTLIGEAYFDVKHMNSKPFIIHTGTVKTTVLGTAFDIKAWPEQKNVTVSVTRGKVRVEDDKKVLAVLTVNQSIDYNLENTATTHQTVNAEEVVNDWTNEDMNFDRTSFELIAKVLSKRFGKDISISDTQLANTPITSSFSGTESLENILNILCTINSDTRFEINANQVTIKKNN